MSAVAVTGMHRSGTSMVAKSLRLAGLHIGRDDELVPPADDNPDGFYEHAGMVRLNEELLEACGGAWDHPPARPPMAADDPRVAAYSSLGRQLLDGLAAESDTWGWKDPRTCLTGPFWLDLVPDVRVVVCLRHPLEVALSLKRRNQASYTLALSLWLDYYRSLLDWVEEERRMVTHYAAYFERGDHELGRIVEFAGLPPGAVTLARPGPDAQRRHHRVAIALSEDELPAETVELYRSLCAEAGWAPEYARARTVPATVARLRIDLEAAGQQLERRARQATSLENERTQLRARIAELEARVSELDARLERAADVAAVAERIAALEQTVFDVGYRLESQSGGTDAAVAGSCRELVLRHVPRDDEVLVVAKGEPALLDLYGRRAANFPQDRSGGYPGFVFAHDSAAIAHLEAKRLEGSRFLLIPETARWWLDHYRRFSAHLRLRYRVPADRRGAGVLVDLRERQQPVHGSPGALAEVMDRLSVGGAAPAAVLDWTRVGISPYLGGRVFAPPSPAELLPYLDDSVEIVVVDDQSRLAEARRVAQRAVIVLGPHDGGAPQVHGVEPLTADPRHRTQTRSVGVLIAAAEPDPLWRRHLEEALGEVEGCKLLFADDPAALLSCVVELDAVAVIDEGVLPLPDCFQAAWPVLGDERVGAVAVKLLSRDGSIEAAGELVFADGSCGGIAEGSHDVAAPWHEHVRAVCGSRGMTLYSGPALSKLPSPEGVPSSATHLVWCAQLWSSGLRVRYQPEATALRALDAPPVGGPVHAAVRAAWAPVLAARPERPRSLDDPAWRALVSRDDVEASWR
jgi:hypothetical protein